MESTEGIFEVRYVAFLETIATLRPKLHRYCARMTGSVLDGEDVVQDALFQAYRKLDTFDDSRPLAPWLFRIAHNQCIDFLRRREVREDAEADAAVADSVEPTDAVGPGVGRAIEKLVLALPPKERACVLLKDVFEYSLEEIAELVDSTVGGVKAALSRGRAKLATLSPQTLSAPREEKPPEVLRLLSLYVERFNRRDWGGLRELISADARLRVADRYAGGLPGAPYFANYARRPFAWRAALGDIDGEVAVIVFSERAGEWIPSSIVRVDATAESVVRIVDYTHCPWVLSSVESLVVSSAEHRTYP